MASFVHVHPLLSASDWFSRGLADSGAGDVVVEAFALNCARPEDAAALCWAKGWRRTHLRHSCPSGRDGHSGPQGAA
jgi:hypothetical protein